MFCLVVCNRGHQEENWMAHFRQHNFLFNCIKILENNKLGGKELIIAKLRKTRNRLYEYIVYEMKN